MKQSDDEGDRLVKVGNCSGTIGGVDACQVLQCTPCISWDSYIYVSILYPLAYFYEVVLCVGSVCKLFSCFQGDSGGPLWVEWDSRATLIGS